MKWALKLKILRQQGSQTVNVSSAKAPQKLHRNFTVAHLMQIRLPSIRRFCLIPQTLQQDVAAYFLDPGSGCRSDRFIVKAALRLSLLLLTKQNALPGCGRPGRASEFSDTPPIVPEVGRELAYPGSISTTY